MDSRDLFLFAAALGCVAVIVWAVETWLGRIRDAIVDVSSEIAQLRRQLAVSPANTAQLYREAVAPQRVPVIDDSSITPDARELIANVRRTMPPSRSL